MRYKISIRSLLLPLAVFFSASAEISAQTYSGQAAVGSATIRVAGQRVITTGIADTGDLPNSGGNISLSTIAVGVPGLLSVSSPLSVGSSTSSTAGSGALSQSQAAVNSVNINVLGNVISATAVGSNTTASCPSEFLVGNSSVTDLQINSLGVSVLGSANQMEQIFVLGNLVGTLIINEEVITPRSITRNALHLFVTDPNDGTTIDVVVGSSRSGINCGFAPSTNLYSGRGTSLRLRQGGVLDVSTILADTGWLPTSGGSISDSTAAVNLGTGILSGISLGTSAVDSSTSGGLPGGNINTSQSDSSVDNLGVNLLAGTVAVGATVLSSSTNCQCSLSAPTCTGNSTVTGLAVSVLGIPFGLTVSGAPNQVINVPVPGLGSIRLTLNGRTSAGAGDITAFPLRVQTSLLGLTETDLLVANSHSDIVCGLPASAAPATISGRVLDRNGRGLPKATISLTDGNGFARSTQTSTFGYYSFRSVPTGKTYFIFATVRGAVYEPQTVSLDDSFANFDLFPSVTVRKQQLKAEARSKSSLPEETRSSRSKEMW